jgi:hypothetical protein
MRVHSHRREWLLSFALFAVILLAMVMAVLLQAPPETVLP